MIDGRIVGAALVFGASTWTGFQAAASVRKMRRQLAQLRLSLELMRCEISCRLTPARKLAGILKGACQGEISHYYANLEDGLLRGLSMQEAAQAAKKGCRLMLPPPVAQSMDALFAGFGGYDAKAQLRQIELTQLELASAIETLEREEKSRCRCYEILGACTGLSLAILVA